MEMLIISVSESSSTSSKKKTNIMAGCLRYSETEFVLKKGENDIPVDKCKGWFKACEYCDKRFCEWIPTDSEIATRIPDMPGFLMIALKNKNISEVVAILFDQSNIQKIATSKIDGIKRQISDKKSKEKKSEILVRWMVMKKLDDKENSILCAHWYNNEKLPRFSSTWPGQTLMENSKALVFSEQLQRWCYPHKEPVWRKPKAIPSKRIQEVQKCTWDSCQVCDSYFTKWLSLSEVAEKDSAPSLQGLVMLSVVFRKNRKVLVVDCHQKYIAVSIKLTVRDLHKNEANFFKEFVNKNPVLEVRWIVLEDIDNDSSCFLYAHWLNADNWPPYSNTYYPLPGETALNKNKHFVFRNADKKWFYEIESFRISKFSKIKSRRRLLDELNSEDDGEYEVEQS